MDPRAKVDMTNVDVELVRRSKEFMKQSVKDDKPFFLWHNSTRMHVFTHLDPKSGRVKAALACTLMA